MFNKALIVAALVAYSAEAAPGRAGRGRGNNSKLNFDRAFQEYAARFNKNIEDTANYLTRQENYHKADNIIKKQNAKSRKEDKKALRFAHNQFSDMPPEEFQANWLGLKKDMAHNESSGLPLHSKGKGKGRGLETIPSSVNWATAGHMHPVKNQGGCGSCWAFAVNTTLEGTLAVKTGKKYGVDGYNLRLSEQQGVDCTLTASQGGGYNDVDWGCWGCQGCWMSNFYNYIKSYGIMTNDDYPYTASQTGNCDAYSASATVGKVDYYYQFNFNNGDSIDTMMARVAQQPLDVALAASEYPFQYYSGGIVKSGDGCGDSLDHAVTIVGYENCGGNIDPDDGTNPDDNVTPDPDPAPVSDCTVDKWWFSCNETAARRELNDTCIPYWIVQNSWGQYWGDQGFIKIEMTGGAGVCGINKVAEYAEWLNMY